MVEIRQIIVPRIVIMPRTRARHASQEDESEPNSPALQDQARESESPEPGRTSVSLTMPGEDDTDDDIQDPDMILRRNIDLAFFDKEIGQYPLPKTDDPLKLKKSITIPHIDMDADPDAMAILNFIYEILAFPIDNKEIMTIILMNAIEGHKAKGWLRSARYDFKKVLAVIINRLVRRRDWTDLTAKLQRGEKFSDDLVEHIRCFKLVAMCMGLAHDSEQTKQLFLDSVEQLNVEPEMSDGDLKTFNQLITITLRKKKTI